MKSRWNDEEARQAIQQWGRTQGEEFALRLYTARLIGQEPELVLPGGGNVSLKAPRRTILGEERSVVYVKASGCDLARLDPASIPAVDLEPLRRLQSLDHLPDEDMVRAFLRHRLDPQAPTPSVETLLHAFLPHRVIDHSHADAVLALTNQPAGEAWVRRVLGPSVAIVPYARPGFALARAVSEVYQQNPAATGLVLMRHGLVTFGDDVRTTYERHIAFVDACERFLEEHAKGSTLTPAFSTDKPPSELARLAAPLLRGLLARPTQDEDQPYRRPILAWSQAPDLLAFVNSREAQTLAETGAANGDHVIRTGAFSLFLSHPDWSHVTHLREQLQSAIQQYQHRYESHHAPPGGSAPPIDTNPKVVLLPGAGAFCQAPTRREARLAADITQHTIAIKRKAQALHRYEPLSPDQAYDMETHPMQQAKCRYDDTQLLEGQVVVISGGAGAIGAAVARVCLDAGAHVALTDRDDEKRIRAVERLQSRFQPERILGVPMDVTDESSVSAGLADVVRFFGGVDVLVVNAGIAHVASIDALQAEDLRRVMEVNTIDAFRFLQEGARIMQQQGLGGNIVINASKNVFAPGKDFGAYSASKAACHQLGKVAAIELAPFGIRVNMINADAIFGDEENPSGLWAAVGPQRARSRNLPWEELPRYYQNRNLLKARIRGEHVGRAVVFFASNATPTTGATLPIDGGVVEAFPR